MQTLFGFPQVVPCTTFDMEKVRLLVCIGAGVGLAVGSIVGAGVGSGVGSGVGKGVGRAVGTFLILACREAG